MHAKKEQDLLTTFGKIWARYGKRIYIFEVGCRLDTQGCRARAMGCAGNVCIDIFQSIKRMIIS